MIPTVTPAGDVISAGSLPAPELEFSSNIFEEFALHRGQVIAVYAVDAPNNSSGERSASRYTVYDVLVIYPDGATTVLSRCRMLQPGFGGSPNDFWEVLLPDPGPDAKNLDKSAALKRGNHVLVAAIGASKNAGVILGCLPHQSDLAVKRRPKKAKGAHLEWEFRGLNFQVTNDGAWKITFVGPRRDSGSPANPSLGPTSVEIDKTGSFVVQTNQLQTIQVDRVTKKISILNGTVSFELDQDLEKITAVAKDVEIQASGDLKAIVQGDAEIKSEKNAIVSAANEIHLARSDKATEPFVLGNKWLEIMKDLCDAIAEIRVIGNLGQITTTPVNASRFGAISSKLDSVLSKLIKGEK